METTSRKFESVAMLPGNPKWDQAIHREGTLYSREDDIRSPFERDNGRILHCLAYRRLKHKTQVFFSPDNDHICTRIEHVNHVASVSRTIAKELGLNEELVYAIALGHDVGHAPFGHHGEKILDGLCQPTGRFWHEQHSLRVLDLIEAMPGPDGKQHALALTYAVRDGVVTHCGEVHEERIVPRENAVDLYSITGAGSIPSYSWEGCVVKLADKIAYLGRDIEDALMLGIIEESMLESLVRYACSIGVSVETISNNALIHHFIIDVCRTSSIAEGIGLSANYLQLMKRVGEFSKDHIYCHPRLEWYKKYGNLILQSIYEYLLQQYSGERTLTVLSTRLKRKSLLLVYFIEYLNQKVGDEEAGHLPLYNLANEQDYKQACIDFIAGMTDGFAERCFQELVSFS